jgi:outer membrane protein assembly factor BamB
VLVGDYLYGSSGVTLVCAEFKSGQIQWSERVPAPGALCYADDRLYVHEENGTITLIEATPEGYREHGRVTPPNPPVSANRMEKAWAHPVIADGRLFVRNNESLWCYDIKHISGSAQ